MRYQSERTGALYYERSKLSSRINEQSIKVKYLI